jgi:hypothetical protein
MLSETGDAQAALCSSGAQSCRSRYVPTDLTTAPISQLEGRSQLGHFPLPCLHSRQISLVILWNAQAAAFCFGRNRGEGVKIHESNFFCGTTLPNPVQSDLSNAALTRFPRLLVPAFLPESLGLEIVLDATERR